MTITVEKVTDPKFSHSDGGTIDVSLHTKEQGVIPCTLHPDDPVEYVTGQDAKTKTLVKETNGALYEKAKDGAFGPVAAFGA